MGVRCHGPWSVPVVAQVAGRQTERKRSSARACDEHNGKHVSRQTWRLSVSLLEGRSHGLRD